jgi:hypothetical protein
LEKEFRTLLLNMIRDLKEESNKQINEVRKIFEERREERV